MTGMTGMAGVAGVAGDGTPRVRLIDARMAGLADLADLRAYARAVSEEMGGGRVSRSYCFPLAVVACHEDAVGVDIERIEPCDEGFLESIMTPAERSGRVAWQARDHDPGRAGAVDTDSDQDRAAISLWSSKEALAKALGDALDYDPRRLDSPAAWRDGRSGPWRAARLEVDPMHIVWVCWRAQP